MPFRTPADEIHIHVHHPPVEGEIMLRTSLDWDENVAPELIDSDGERFEFVLRGVEEPFVYFKPLILVDGEERWASGPDRLATSGAERIRDTFPTFEDAPARVTEPEAIDSEDGAWTHRVFLPEGYGENTLRRYPVLYMNDGHNLYFGPQSRLTARWSVQDTMSRLVEMTAIEQAIVVAVYPRDRMVDYTEAGEEAYGRYLANVLKPHIDAGYLTLPDAAHNAIMGSSLGGVSALSCAWEHPESFGLAGCMSASFGYENDLKERVLKNPKPDIRVYLDSGWPRDNFEVTRDMRARLVRAGFTEGVDLLYFAFPGGRHSEVDWGDRSHLPFQFFFGHRPDVRSVAGRHVRGEGED